MEEEQQGEIKALLMVLIKVLISLSYTYFIVSKLPKGIFRFLSLLPIFSLFTLLPLSLSTPTTTGLTGFFFTWLANFKLFLFSFDLGPLSHHLPKNSFFNFIFLASFPIKINPKINKIDPKLKFPPNFLSKTLIYAFLVVGGFRFDYNEILHPKLLLGIYCCLVYLNLEIILGICNYLIGYFLDVELSPPFDEPYLSTSVQDFWGRRWNLMVSDVLRHTIYLPVRAFWEIRLGREWASAIAVMAAFGVSGAMHELLFYYITRAKPTWEVTCFFVVHGVCLVLENGLKRALGLGQKLRLHWALSGPLTVGFVMVTGFGLFFPQLVRNQVDVRSLEEVKAVGKFVKGLLGWETS